MAVRVVVPSQVVFFPILCLTVLSFFFSLQCLPTPQPKNATPSTLLDVPPMITNTTEMPMWDAPSLKWHGSAPDRETVVVPSSPEATSSSAVLSPPADQSEEFRMERLERSVGGVCGKNKCMFRVHGRPGVGYLVTQKVALPILQETWEFGERLVAGYGIRHLSEEPREVYNITAQFASMLSANLTLHQNLRGDKFAMTFPSDAPLIVQKVAIVPQPSLLVACRFNKFTRTMQDLDTFLVSLHTSTTDRKVFIRNLDKSIEVTKKMMREARCLIIDFHAILDIQGNLNHIDLDRCFPQPPNLPGGQVCFKNLGVILERAKTILSNLTVAEHTTAAL
jgi:hypothetical protein